MEERGLSKSLVPEVGVPSVNELVLSNVEGGQARLLGFEPRGILSQYPTTGRFPIIFGYL
jgi:hypothetical protein